MMSDTPRTRAAIRTYGDYIRSEDAVSIEFAEQLETELAEALGEIKRLRRLVNDCHIVAGQLETERNEARAEIERLKEAVKTVQSAFKNYKNADAEAARIEMREAKILAASCNSDSVNSERAANAILTDEIERKDKLIEQMRQTLIEALLSCDATWESKNLGHDWQYACEQMRAALEAAERGEG